MANKVEKAIHRIIAGFRHALTNDRFVLLALGVVVGALGAGSVILLLKAIELFQLFFFNTASHRLLPGLADLAWWHILLAPTIGGLLVGIFVHNLMPEGRPQGVADVMEASALKGGRMSLSTGLTAAGISALSMGAGASVGREGPAVHLGATLASWIGERFHLSRSRMRTLLGCGVAAAVAASFNAPLAGALFASEVVIGHYALSAFAPVVVASVVATALSRSYFGDYPAFVLPDQYIASIWEFPAFIGLGILAGLAAISLIFITRITQDGALEIPLPPWLKPAIGGFIIGCMALVLPQILGVGYGTSEQALNGELGLFLLILICGAKILATGVSLGFGFGGGVFSPSLVIGATLGGAYGIIVTVINPDLSSGQTAYTLIGMGAVSAAVLGAPISTVLIIFEMTANYPLTMAVMTAAVIATTLSHQLQSHSFFLWQLARRGVNLREGVETALMQGVQVGDLALEKLTLVETNTCLPEIRELIRRDASNELFVVHPNGALYGTITLADLSESAFDKSMDMMLNAEDVARARPPMLIPGDTLDHALKVMRDSGEHFIAVVNNRSDRKPLGGIHERDVMAAYSRVLLEARREEHDQV